MYSMKLKVISMTVIKNIFPCSHRFVIKRYFTLCKIIFCTIICLISLDIWTLETMHFIRLYDTHYRVHLLLLCLWSFSFIWYLQNTVFQKLDLFLVWVGASPTSHLRMEKFPILKTLFPVQNTKWWMKSRNPVILNSVYQHHSPLELLLCCTTSILLWHV